MQQLGEESMMALVSCAWGRSVPVLWQPEVLRQPEVLLQAPRSAKGSLLFTQSINK